MFDTKFCENRPRPLNLRGIRSLYFFFIVASNLKNSMYPRSVLCEKVKIKQHTSSMKELCETGEEVIWESRFTCFLAFLIPKTKLLFQLVSTIGISFLYVFIGILHINFNEVNKIDHRMLPYLYFPDNKNLQFGGNNMLMNI